jgi:hypothetical protein
VTVFATAIDTIFADPNIGEDALWLPGGVGPGMPIRVIRKSPDKVVEFGDSRAITDTVLLDVRRSEAAAIASGDRIVIGAETFEIIGEPMSDAIVLVFSCEVARV